MSRIDAFEHFMSEWMESLRKGFSEEYDREKQEVGAADVGGDKA